MSSRSRARLASLLNIAESATDLRTKLGSLRRVHQILLQKREDEKEDEEDEKGFSSFFSGLLPRFFALLSDENPPVRKFVTEVIGEIGMKYSECVPDIVPVLIGTLEDRTPVVARQAIKCGINLFRSTLERVAVQGLYASELDECLKSSWASVLEFKEKIYSLGFQQGSGGVRLLALKCVEAIILLYTPDPSGSPEPPALQKGDSLDFNISWIRGRHPVLNAGDLSIEASKTLSLFLDQLRLPTIKSLSNLVIIVLINSLAKIAKKRPPYYGRILPVLLGLDPSKSVIQGTHAYGACLALKNAFLSCLKCPHPCAAPWRDRLVGALREMKVGGMSEDILLQTTSMRNGNVEQGEGDSPVDKEEKPLVKLDNNVSSVLGRKRSLEDEYVSSIEDDSVSGKRVRSITSGSDESTRELSNKASDFKDDSASDGRTSCKSVNDSGPVQQLVAMFGALVAQGEKAVGSLEILISSISADLLAEVVIAGMHHLPSTSPQAVGDDESLENMTIIGSDTQAKYPPSFLANVLSLSSSFPSITSQLPVQKSISGEEAVPETEEQLHVMDDGGVLDNVCSQVVENEVLATDLPALSTASVRNMDVDDQPITSDIPDVDNLESEIPGLDLSSHNVLDVAGTSSLISINLEDASGEQVTSLSSRSSLDLHSSMSAERSEELSPKAAVMEASSIVSSTATSTHFQSSILLPKMSAPVINLDDNQKDQLQTSAFVRIIEAYKHVATAGGSQVRFSLLAYLGVEFSSEIEPWKLLQTHILSDYLNLEGHELTLCVLYRLFSEVEEDRDFFSSTTAASVYETFLLTVAKTLRDSFPPSDKSLSRLLGEAPYLPKSVLDILVALCSPGDGDKTEKESQSGDRVTQGLSTVWSLILQRPSLRESCLNIALQSAVHNLEEVRMKAIRLVANKLFPLPFCARQIEDFAMGKLLSVAQVDVTDSIDTEGSIAELPKVSDSEKQSNELQSASAISTDISSDTHQVRPSQSALSLTTSEAQRCTSLYFALCTKKHSLLHQIFVIYRSASKAVKQAINLHIPILVRTIGSSPGLLEIISDPPDGSEDLLMQVLQTLTEGTGPPPELLVTTRKLYDSKLKNAEILIPILPFLPRDEVLLIFPQLVNLPLDKFQVALSRVLQGSSLSGPVLTPSEVLIAIHGIDPNRDGIPLKKVTDACNSCFEQRQIFTQQVLAKVLNQLVEQIPLPLLFMRTVLQAIGAFPALVDFILEILSRLVNKQIWKYPKLWVGFLKCADLTKPQSFSVLLQLPPPQLENALHRTPALKAPLVAHASQPNIKASLPRSVLATLGITADSQTSSQAPTVETSNSEKEVQTEISKESSNAS